jgi:hypothetical protein
MWLGKRVGEPERREITLESDRVRGRGGRGERERERETMLDPENSGVR